MPGQASEYVEVYRSSLANQARLSVQYYVLWTLDLAGKQKMRLLR
jgi:hypothetical protein